MRRRAEGLGAIGQRYPRRTWDEALDLVAFILAIVAMSKSGAGAGLWQLLASLLVSPFIYLVGLGLLAGIIGATNPDATMNLLQR